MKRQAIGAALALVFVPGAARAHDAFGDLGPFYGGLLHPLADPAQGLIVIALAVLLARQSRQSVQAALPAIVACAVVALLAHAVTQPPVLGTRVLGLIVATIGLVALVGRRLPVVVTVATAGMLAGVTALAQDVPDRPRALALSTCGSALGMAIWVLWIWSVLDLLQADLGRIAGAVASSWVAAIGVMAAALPAMT